VATTLPDVIRGAQPQQPSVALFWEPGIRAIQGSDFTLETLQNALNGFRVTVLNERALREVLSTTPFDLFITPYGSAFPKRAWPEILKYLQAGGNWLNLGGVPLSIPVERDGAEWSVGQTQTSYHKRIGITHYFAVNRKQMPLVPASFEAYEVYELYVRLSSSSNAPDEAGSDGPHEGVVQPLQRVLNADGRTVAAPVIQIDRLSGEFAGGRWVLANFFGKIDGATVALLAQRAAQGASRFEVKSNFASYQPGETPTLSVELLRPKGDLQKLGVKNCSIEVKDNADRIVSRLDVRFDVENSRATGSVQLPDAAKLAPGLYKLQAQTNIDLGQLTHTNAFWIYDAALLARGKPLTVDKNFFYRNGELFPVTGTTYMASDKHRRFLFEPNPFVWDSDFQNMKTAGVNMVRTGIWTGWKKYMPEPGKLNEATLRAFDAFLLTAHKHDIPVIFTFFAFLPESWGGENAYLDPRSVKAQQQFISAFTERCRQIDDVMWDFINEPSFCSPKYLWNCRPNYDAHEQAEWKQWLRDRYPNLSDEERASHLQEIWHTSDNSFDLPKLQDFESVHLIDDRLPLKTVDYRLFAQEMFIRWVRDMTKAIRSNGNTKQLITVGQDEGGLGDSPNPQFFEREVDFTSMHNWWNNDDLLWDSVLAKTPSKLNLTEETGVMFYEKADGGAAWRSEEEASNLLERKLALSFAANGAGFIEWIWNTNPYMNSTNEVGIGFHRVDGSAKPELEPFLRIAKFMGQCGHYLKDRIPEPVLMVIPHSQMFAPRTFAHEATRRCVRAMYYHCGVPVQAVSDYMLPQYREQAKLIMVPSPVTQSEKCWKALVARARQGATIALSGAIDRDEYQLVFWKFPARPMKQVSVVESEAITIGAREYLVRYDGEKMQRIEKAVDQSNPAFRAKPFVIYQDPGKFIWSTLPLELGDSTPALVAFYRMALAEARVAPVFTAIPRTPAVLILPSLFRDVVLYTLVSETDHDTRMQITDLESHARFSALVPAQRTAMVLLERKTGKIIGRL